MVLKDISFQSPKENIAFDDVLLYLAERGNSQESIRLWEMPSVCIVLGLTQAACDDVRLENASGDRVPILRRSSGGGTVVQGKGCLNYSLVLSKEKTHGLCDLRRSYQLILEKIISAHAKLGIELVFRPVSDLALLSNDKKVSGNAQKRGRKYILHHGTILYDFELPLMERYLKLPKSMPGYRLNRDHLDFVTNVPADSVSIRDSLCAQFGVEKIETDPREEELEYLDNILKQKGRALCGRSAVF